MQKNRKIWAVRKALGKEDFPKGDELVYHCPKCKHYKSKLSINVVTDQFHCWACDWRGKNLVPILRLSRDASLVDEYLDGREDLAQKREKSKRHVVPVLPREFMSLSTPSSSPYRRVAMSYLSRRGITSDDILRWKLGYCIDGEYQNRIIIPSFDEMGELNFFTGRALSKNMISYRNEDSYDKDIIWNDCMVDWKRPVVVTEGPFDAMKAGDNAIALQGSIFNTGSRLFRKIILTGVPVYFAMDTDAFSKQLRIIERCLGFGICAYYVDLGGRKDVGEMTREQFAEAKERARPVKSELDVMRMRVSR